MQSRRDAPLDLEMTKQSITVCGSQTHGCVELTVAPGTNKCGSDAERDAIPQSRLGAGKGCRDEYKNQVLHTVWDEHAQCQRLLSHRGAGDLFGWDQLCAGLAMVPANVFIQMISSRFKDATRTIRTPERFTEGRSNRFTQGLLGFRVDA